MRESLGKEKYGCEDIKNNLRQTRPIKVAKSAAQEGKCDRNFSNEETVKTCR
jgi:hypothetical protein